jgi:tyrosine type site-specific recombinase
MGNGKEFGRKTPSTLLLAGFAAVIENKKRKGCRRTAANYRATSRKLAAYLGEGAAAFCLQEITAPWVGGFVEWLREQHEGRPQTADFYLRNLRAMCSHLLCLRHLRWEGGASPFAGIRIKGVRPAKRALTEGEVRRLTRPSLRERLPADLRRTLDVLLFILYERGMVFQDVYNLTWDMVSPDGHIFYLRSKTHRPIDAEVTPEAARIMERYQRSDSGWVFPFLHERCYAGRRALSEESALRRINAQAKCIGAAADIPIPLTTYVMRHTWATLMLEAGKSVELIGQCLGHTSIQTTQIYLSNISVNRVDREVDDMITRMLRPTPASRAKDTRPAPRAKSSRRRAEPAPKHRASTMHKTKPVTRKKETDSGFRRTISGMIRKIPFLGKKEKVRRNGSL